MNTDKIIDRAQTFLKTDVRYLLRGGFWLTIGQFFSSGSTFLVAIAFANLLPKETYGAYGYILSIFSILLIPTLTGMDTAVTQAISVGKEKTFNLAFKTKVRFGLLGVIASFGVAIYYFFNGNYLFSVCFALIAAFIPLIESFDMYNAILQGRQEVKQFTFYNSSTQIISAICSICAAILSKNLVVLVVTFVVINTILNLIFLWLTLRKKPLEGLSDPEAITYGKHLSLMDILNTAVGQLDKILVFHYLGAAELAIYGLAIAPPEQLKGLLKNISYLAMPRFAQRSIEEVKETLLPRLLKFGFFVAIGIIVYILLAPYLYHLFFKQYPEAVAYSQLFSISLFAVTLSMIPSAFMQAHSAKKELYQFSLIANIVTVAVLFPFVVFGGLLGMIIGRIIIRFIFLFVSLVLAFGLKTKNA